MSKKQKLIESIADIVIEKLQLDEARDYISFGRKSHAPGKTTDDGVVVREYIDLGAGNVSYKFTDEAVIATTRFLFKKDGVEEVIDVQWTIPVEMLVNYLKTSRNDGLLPGQIIKPRLENPSVELRLFIYGQLDRQTAQDMLDDWKDSQ